MICCNLQVSVGILTRIQLRSPHDMDEQNNSVQKQGMAALEEPGSNQEFENYRLVEAIPDFTENPQ